MPVWSKIFAELLATGQPPHLDFDGIRRKYLLDYGLRVTELEDDPDLQDLSLSVFYATTHTFSLTPIVKIVESHTGHAFIQHYRPPPSPQQAIQVDLGIAPDQPM